MKDSQHVSLRLYTFWLRNDFLYNNSTLTFDFDTEKSLNQSILCKLADFLVRFFVNFSEFEQVANPKQFFFHAIQLWHGTILAPMKTV